MYVLKWIKVTLLKVADSIEQIWFVTVEQTLSCAMTLSQSLIWHNGELRHDHKLLIYLMSLIKPILSALTYGSVLHSLWKKFFGSLFLTLETLSRKFRKTEPKTFFSSSECNMLSYWPNRLMHVYTCNGGLIIGSKRKVAACPWPLASVVTVCLLVEMSFFRTNVFIDLHLIFITLEVQVKEEPPLNCRQMHSLHSVHIPQLRILSQSHYRTANSVGAPSTVWQGYIPD